MQPPRRISDKGRLSVGSPVIAKVGAVNSLIFDTFYRLFAYEVDSNEETVWSNDLVRLRATLKVNLLPSGFFSTSVFF